MKCTKGTKPFRVRTVFYPHYIEKHRHGGQGKIGGRKREDPGNEAVRKWKTGPAPSRVPVTSSHRQENKFKIQDTFDL